MRVVVQRVKSASVKVENNICGKIDSGILAYVGFGIDDNNEDIDWIVRKLPNLRIFTDSDGKMNLSIKDLGYGILVVSQFTLFGSCKKGYRPSYDSAAKPDDARLLYNKFLYKLKATDVNVETGMFQEHMDVSYINDGPVTIILDSKNR